MNRKFYKGDRMLTYRQDGEKGNDMENQKALDAFMKAIGKIDPLLDELKQVVVDNHIGIAPENVNWGHVGSACHILDLLEYAAVAAGIRPED